MPLIKVREDENLENALKRFKRKCEKSGILTEIKKRQQNLFKKGPYLFYRMTSKQ